MQTSYIDACRLKSFDGRKTTQSLDHRQCGVHGLSLVFKKDSGGAGQRRWGIMKECVKRVDRACLGDKKGADCEKQK